MTAAVCAGTGGGPRRTGQPAVLCIARRVRATLAAVLLAASAAGSADAAGGEAGASAAAGVTEAVRAASTPASRPAAPRIERLEDPGGRLQVADLARPDIASRFVASREASPNLGITRSAWWLRITIAPGLPAGLVEVAAREVGVAEFHRPLAGGGFERVRAGSSVPLGEWEIRSRQPVFRHLAGGEHGTVHYLRATAGPSSLALPLRFWAEPAFRDALAADHLWQGLYVGVMLAMALYNLFVWTGVRDRAYLYYVVWVLGFALAVLARNGMASLWWWPDAPEFNRWVIFVAFVVSLAASLQFTRALLETRPRVPRLDRAIGAVAAALPLVLLPALAGWWPATMVAMQAGGIATVVCGVTAGLVVWRQGYRPAGVYLSAFAVMWLVAALQAAQGLGLVSGFEGMAHQGMQLGSAVEVVIFALALASRINGLVADKERAQAEALASQNLALQAARRGEVELERRVAERTDDLRRARDEAQQASQAKTRFLAAASHDLRQPVHAIGLLVGALREHAQQPEARRVADRIDESIEAIDGLFNALLDISRLDSGAVVAKPEAVRLDELLARVELSLGPDAQAKGLRLAVRPSAALVHTDPVLLDRIVRNLVSNAIRYTRRGGVLVGARRRGARLVLQVWDTGTGIEPAQQESIFEEFVQLRRAEAEPAIGLGLGLSIVRRLARLLGHEVRLCSVPGCGSRFEVELPWAGAAPRAALTGADAAAGPAAEGGVPPTDLRGLFIVVIDDAADVRAGSALTLGQAGARVLCAASGAEAVALLDEHLRPPDLIIADWQLAGGATGADAIVMVRAAQGASIAALVVTGAAGTDAARAAGVPVVHKPLTAARLCAEVARAVAPLKAAGAGGGEAAAGA